MCQWQRLAVSNPCLGGAVSTFWTELLGVFSSLLEETTIILSHHSWSVLSSVHQSESFLPVSAGTLKRSCLLAEAVSAGLLYMSLRSYTYFENLLVIFLARTRAKYMYYFVSPTLGLAWCWQVWVAMVETLPATETSVVQSTLDDGVCNSNTMY